MRIAPKPRRLTSKTPPMRKLPDCAAVVIANPREIFGKRLGPKMLGDKRPHSPKAAMSTAAICNGRQQFLTENQNVVYNMLMTIHAASAHSLSSRSAWRHLTHRGWSKLPGKYFGRSSPVTH